MQKKILIADDHEIVRLGMRLLVTEALGNCLIDFAENGSTLAEAVKRTKYDLLITDINMPGNEAVASLANLLITDPALKALVISVLPESIYAPRYLKAGAYGYLEKGSSNERIKKAIQYIIQDKKFYSTDLLLSISESRTAQAVNPFEVLGGRELEVIMLLLKGKAIGEAAVGLNMHISTASTHKVRAFKKLGVENLRELLDLAKLHHLL